MEGSRTAFLQSFLLPRKASFVLSRFRQHVCRLNSISRDRVELLRKYSNSLQYAKETQFSIEMHETWPSICALSNCHKNRRGEALGRRLSALNSSEDYQEATTGRLAFL